MTMLRYITAGLPKSLLEQLNEMTLRIAAFEKMSGDGRVRVNWSHHVPALSLGSLPPNVMVAKADADIDPLSGAAPGYGDVTEWLWRGDTREFTESAGDPFTAFNLSGTAVTADKFLVLVQIAGAWFIIFEACDG